MTTHAPTYGLIPSEKSVIKLAYDDQYLYLSGILLVSDPKYINAIGKKRDMMIMTTDYFGINFDTYNDKENALLFYTNPLGFRWDASIRNDATPIRMEMPMNVDWNTFWDVNTAIDEQGWYAEMRIPISSLRFQKHENKTIMGISVMRWIPAKNEAYTYPAMSNEYGQMSNFKPSLYEEVEFEGLNPRKPLYIAPYVISGFEQSYSLNDAETDYVYDQEYHIEPGLDIKYGINPNTILDLTVNTDFAQVEADDQQFNLTRFSLFYPEKRMFFLERSSNFDFSLGGNTNLFYSRRIGLHEGDPVRIWGGARLNSRINDWDIGLLNIQTASYLDLPSENFGVFRTKKRIINNYSYAGGMITSRLGVDGTYNLGYGLDGVIRVVGDDYLTVRWAQTFQDAEENKAISLDPTRFFVSWQRRKQEGFAYSGMFTYSGTDFDPGIGFELFDDYFAGAVHLAFNWISPEESWLQTHNIGTLNYRMSSLVDGSLLIAVSSWGWSFNSKSNWMGEIYVDYNMENLEQEFEILDPVSVPAGNYQFFSTDFMLQTSGTKPFYTTFMFEGGGYYDGMKFSPRIEPSWNVGASVELAGIYQLDYVNFPGRDQTLANHIGGFRALYMLSTKISFSGFVQYNSAINKVISNLRFRYNPKEGTDFYLVFNEGRNTFLEREMPIFPAYNQRNLTVKFTYTFEK